MLASNLSLTAIFSLPSSICFPSSKIATSRLLALPSRSPSETFLPLLPSTYLLPPPSPLVGTQPVSLPCLIQHPIFKMKLIPTLAFAAGVAVSTVSAFATFKHHGVRPSLFTPCLPCT
jgi:hypothetical protein